MLCPFLYLEKVPWLCYACMADLDEYRTVGN
jgi:hypothetical protein